MGIRALCLICAAAVLMMAFFGIRAGAQPWQCAPSVRSAPARSSTIRSTTPLASAMLLVLGGLGIALLFDRKNKK